MLDKDLVSFCDFSLFKIYGALKHFGLIFQTFLFWANTASRGKEETLSCFSEALRRCCLEAHGKIVRDSAPFRRNCRCCTNFHGSSQSGSNVLLWSLFPLWALDPFFVRVLHKVNFNFPRKNFTKSLQNVYFPSKDSKFANLGRTSKM